MNNKDITIVSLTTLIALGLGVAVTTFAHTKLNADRDLINAQNDAKIAEIRIEQSKQHRNQLQDNRSSKSNLELIEVRELYKLSIAKNDALLTEVQNLKSTKASLQNEKASLQNQILQLQAEVAGLEDELQAQATSTSLDTDSPEPCIDDSTGEYIEGCPG